MTAPSVAFRRHHDVTPPRIDGGAFHPAWRVNARLDQLFAERLIDLQAWLSAISFRNDVESALMRSRDSLAVQPSGGGGSAHEGQAMRVKALHRLALIAECLGRADYQTLEMCCVFDLPWAEIGRKRATSDKTAKAWTVAALRRLGGLDPSTSVALGLRGGQGGVSGAGGVRRADRFARRL